MHTARARSLLADKAMGHFNGMSWDFSNECSSILQLPHKVTVIWSLERSKIWMVESKNSMLDLCGKKNAMGDWFSNSNYYLHHTAYTRKEKGSGEEKSIQYLCVLIQLNGALVELETLFATPCSFGEEAITFLPTSSSWSNPGQIFQHHRWWLRSDVRPHWPYKERAYQSVHSIEIYWLKSEWNGKSII